jgi:hypothetical protein
VVSSRTYFKTGVKLKTPDLLLAAENCELDACPMRGKD